MFRLFIYINFLLLLSCKANQDLRELDDCFYKNLDRGSLDIKYFESMYLIAIDAEVQKMSKDVSLILYSVFEIDGDPDNNYVLALLLDIDGDSSLFKISANRIVINIIELSEEEEEKIAGLKNRILNIENPYFERECEVEGGVKGILSIKKYYSDTIDFYFKSVGIECDELDSSRNFLKAAELVSLMKKIR